MRCAVDTERRCGTRSVAESFVLDIVFVAADVVDVTDDAVTTVAEL